MVLNHHFLVKTIQAFYYGVELDGRINYDKLWILQNLSTKNHRLWCICIRKRIDFAKFREIADAVGAILFADIAHIAGLLLLVSIWVHSLMQML